MKFLNKVMCAVLFFAIGSIGARTIGVKTTPTPQQPVTSPTSIPAPAKGQIQAQSYKQIHDNILRMTQAFVIQAGQLTNNFILQITPQAKAADIGSDGFKALLQTARDKFMSFEGDDRKDLLKLRAINQQIEQLTANF